jgi:hypothetical protein
MTIIEECRRCRKSVLGKLEKAKKSLNRFTLDDLQSKNKFNVDVPYIKKRIVDALEYIEEAQKELK